MQVAGPAGEPQWAGRSKLRNCNVRGISTGIAVQSQPTG